MSKNKEYESITVKIRKNITPLIEIGRKKHQEDRGTLPSYTVFISEILYKELKKYEEELKKEEETENNKRIKNETKIRKTEILGTKSDEKELGDEITKKSIPLKALEVLKETETMTQREVAEKLKISVKTVEGHMQRIRKHLNAKSGKDALKKAKEMEII